MVLRGLTRSIIRLWTAYNSQLHQNPLQTQIVSSGVLWGLGDYLAQKIENMEQKKDVNYKRLFVTSVYGAVFIGPFGHYWYDYLDRGVRRIFFPKTFAFVATKIVADLAIFDALHILLFFTLLTRTEGGDWQAVKRKLQRDYFPTFGAELSIWVPIHSINFSIVPVKHQLLFVNLMSILDNTFVCWARAQENWMQQILDSVQPALTRGLPQSQEKQQQQQLRQPQSLQQLDRHNS
eukprot:TRINITY_DN3013_c0_g1_i2.p2 TRINITY_DN3013_c0_g1~~TRINITY_DN3013_c0_g1_i2.p2  ORF type:complete len:235 (-),score=17.60 TRINITY_DN3013_c0_g1_i2:978-1682(-)